MTAQIATPRKPSICGRMIFPGRRASTPTHRPGPIGGADRNASVFNMPLRLERLRPLRGLTWTESYKCSATKLPVPGSVPRPLSAGVGMKTVVGVVRIKSDGKEIPFPSPLRTIVQRRKHYSHEPYQKVKSGLNTATAIRPADSTRACR